MKFSQFVHSFRLLIAVSFNHILQFNANAVNNIHSLTFSNRFVQLQSQKRIDPQI